MCICRYYLPATSSAESDDIFNSYGHYTIATSYQAIPPVGESKSNWQVISELAQRMGLDDSFFAMTERELIEHMVSAVRLNFHKTNKMPFYVATWLK